MVTYHRLRTDLQTERVTCFQEVKDFHGCNLLVLREQILVSRALFLSTNIHQGDNLFSVQSRGKQCAFMSSSAVLPAQNIPLIDWSQETLDNVLLQGDKMYLHALGNGYLENTDTLEERLAMKSEAENMADFHVC